MPYAEEILGGYQRGFRKGQSPNDNLFMLRCILEKFYAFNLNLHLLFIDIKQAYDPINKTQSYKTLKEFWIPKKLVNLIKMTLQDSNGKVKI